MPGPEDFFLNCGASIARDLVWGAMREARYCCCFNNFVKDLKREKDELLKCRKTVDEDVKRAKKETKKIDNDYKDWLEKADKLEEQVEQLESKVEKYKSCCLGYLPNWICRNRLGRQLAKKKDDVKLHCDKRPRDGIKRLATLQGMEYFSSENFTRFESRELAHQQLMEAIQDDGVSMIGLYGMGGSGKTTLAKEVGKEVEQLPNYKVVFVVVSREGVRRIQDKIASSLSLAFELNEKEEIERAKRLSMRLRNNDERFLVILDDVWEKLDLEAIGIPFGENCKSCKVLITTRSLDVCNLMDCQKTIPLSLLSFEESWTLFQKHARITNETSDALKDLAEQITKKCGELPIAIAAVANTLKGKPQDEWEVALKTLKHSRPMDIEEGLRDPYTCLELSYNSLKSKEAKSLFLLCSAFPEDCNINVETLTRYAIGLGLFGRASSSYKMARKQVNVAKNKLINSCLLLKVDDEEETKEYVEMHDLVRDVAQWIANKENKVILGPERCENVMEEGMTIKDNQIRYISCYKLPEQLNCSELEFLYLHTDSEQVQVPCEYFKRKGKLRVLVLENDSWQSIPLNLNSIQTLAGLRCLNLMDWELEDISYIGCLQALESLALKSCSFQKLPEAIEQLTNLRLLEVSNCTIEMNPYEAIGKYSYLEELYFVQNHCYEWEFNDETASELLGKFSAPQQLQRYYVAFGKGKDDYNVVGGYIKRILDIEYFDASTSSAAIMDLVGRAEALSLGHIKGGRKNVIPDIIRGVTDLIELIIYDSEEIECLFDNTDLYRQVESIFNLSKLHISQMHHLEALCHGRPSPILFEKLEDIYISECNELHGVLFVGKLNLCNLKVLEVNNCPKLISIFTLNSARSLSQLRHLEITGCDELKHIMIEKVNEEITEDENDRMIKLPNLKLLKLSYLPSIVSIFFGNYIPVWPSLQQLVLNNCPQFTIVTPDNSVTAGSEVRQHESPPMEMGSLIIHGNQRSDEMSRLQTLLGIKKLHVTNSNIESIFQVAGLPLNIELALPLTLHLKSLFLENLHKLNCIFKCSMQMMSLQNLVALHISGCGKIKSIFSASSFISLPQLKDLWIINCEQLEQIIADEEYQNITCSNSTSNSSTLHSGSLDLCILKGLHLRDCPMLKSLFTLSTVKTLTSLEELRVSKCHVLKEIINCESPCGCKKEESGFQSHFSILFPKLKYLKIEECDSLEYIFTSPMEIKLPVLEELRLEELPNLINICPNNYYTVSLCLQKIVLNHVGLSIPTSNILKFGLQDTQWDYTSTKDLGATIMKLLQNSDVGNSNSDEHFIGMENDLLLLREMILQNQQEIKYLCISPKRLLNLQNLLQLTVEGCGKLKAMFSVSVLRSLPQLKEIIIKECEELEQITIEEQENENMSNPYSQKGCFPQLKVLLIKHCNKLKRLFSISTSREFPKLECITIKEASQLKEVFESEKSKTEERKEVVLPQLKYLILVQLPSLTNVCHGIEFQTVRHRVVQNCPNLSLTTAVQKSIQQLKEEMRDYFWPRDDLLEELRDILKSATTETFNEDPMIESKVSDSEDEAASRSEPPSSQIIKEKGKGIVGNGSASRTPAIVTSSTDVHESMDEHSTSEPTLHSQQLALGETKRTTKVPQELIIPSDQEILVFLSNNNKEKATYSAQDIEVVLKESAQKGPAFEEDAIVILSNDLTQRNSPSEGPLVIDPLLKLSHQGVADGVQEGLVIENAKVLASSSQGVADGVQEGLAIEKEKVLASSSQELVKRDSIRKPSLMEQQAIGDRKVTNNAPNLPSDLAKYVIKPEKNSYPKVALEEIAMQTSLIVSKLNNSSLHPSDSSLNKTFSQNTKTVVKQSAQDGPSFEEATIATLSTALAPRNSPPVGSLVIGPLQKAYLPGVIDGVQEGLPIEKAKPVASSSQIILVEQQATEGNEITNISTNLLLDSIQNEPKLKISSLCPSQISSNPGLSPFSSTSMILLAELSSRSRVDKFSASKFLESGLLQELKTKLTQYFNMPLEAIFETNTLDDVESIINSLAKGTTDVIQKNILEDLKSRLKQFKECVPKAISTMQSSLGFMSNHESLNVELNNKLSEGQEKLRDLECKISETCEKEYAIDMEIQQLFAKKMEILEQRKSLASQLNQSTEAVSTDYVKWKALREKLKASTRNWLKSKEDLAHANASWKLFKESLGL